MTIYRDEVDLYIRKHGGSIHIQQTAPDDCEVVLLDADGEVIGEVSPFDRHPKRAKIHEDIPY